MIVIKQVPVTFAVMEFVLVMLVNVVMYVLLVMMDHVLQQHVLIVIQPPTPQILVPRVFLATLLAN